MTKSYPDDLLLIGPLVALFLLLWPPPSADAALRIGDLKQMFTCMQAPMYSAEFMTLVQHDIRGTSNNNFSRLAGWLAGRTAVSTNNLPN